ncbi:endolytic transglycosylase MltG [Bifidobacterium pseudolongum]|uniref:Endolytic murein transglycosylase n=1 Tax=Bifidobacterium pseudolongum subsp. globosum TaxID=1690 RepID=A0A8B3RPI2_9BIFI|nr:endolytic transglycosylase MltG [Bifidobacterium pseudolongum]RYQ44848.1 YceG-like family [Bifidobacterium pseudolongum subsp. globosum]RYQ47202.1 YceG-like family [Bifidobacterium pseudolongum subsp. globosum]
MSDDIHDFFNDDDSWGNAQQDDAGAPPAPLRSRRDMRMKRKSKQRHRMVKLIIAIAVVIALIVGGIYAYRAVKQWRHNTLADSSVVEDYPGPGSGSVAFTVTAGEGMTQIAEHLVREGVIKSVDAFTGVVSANDMTLYPGTYELKHQMKASQAAQILSDQGNAKGFVEVRQGERLQAVLERASEASGIELKDFEAVTTNAEEASKILPAEANGNFEGWLEPGVYNVSADPSATQILTDMVKARISKLDELGVPQGADRERTLIIASIVEAEVNSPEYYGMVSRVIQNRLNDDMSLGMDSTVAYGFGINGTELTNDQLNDGSNPYNTRVNKGLPPTPISNPGDDAVEAAMHPSDGNWLYFVTTNLKTGETKFTDNYDQFEQYVQEYKQNNDGAN